MKLNIWLCFIPLHSQIPSSCIFCWCCRTSCSWLLNLTQFTPFLSFPASGFNLVENVSILLPFMECIVFLTPQVGCVILNILYKSILRYRLVTGLICCQVSLCCLKTKLNFLQNIFSVFSLWTSYSKLVRKYESSSEISAGKDKDKVTLYVNECVLI